MNFTEIEKNILKDRYEKWSQLKEFYATAEKLKESGEKEIVVPIELFLLSRDLFNLLAKI